MKKLANTMLMRQPTMFRGYKNSNLDLGVMFSEEIKENALDL